MANPIVHLLCYPHISMPIAHIPDTAPQKRRAHKISLALHPGNRQLRPFNRVRTKATGAALKAQRRASQSRWREHHGYKSERDILRYDGIALRDQPKIREQARRRFIRSLSMCDAAARIWLLNHGYKIRSWKVWNSLSR